MKRAILPAVSLSCALALGSGLALAQPKSKPRAAETSVFGETLEVRVVNVEVVVTDKDGNRVSGLKPSDFRLKVDGKPVPVDYFSEILGGQSVAPPDAATGTSPAPAGVPGVEPGGAVGTSYLVFIDDYFPTEIRRNEVLKSLKGDLAHLGPEDRMAVVAYDGGRLALISNWSQSQTELAGAFDKAMARPARGLDRAVEFNRFASDQGFASTSLSDSTNRVPGDGNNPLDLNSRMDNSQLTPLEREFSKTLFRQVEGAVNAAARTLRTFASPPGRKVMLLLDGGWPYSIQSFVRGDGPIPSSREFKDGENLIRVLTNTANLLGYTVYPVDVPGTSGAANDVSITSPVGTGAASFRDQEIKGTLEFVALETGGKELRNGNRMVALAQVAADTRTYYWLGFSPTWEHNDSRHKVDVSVPGKPGLKVRSRESFQDLSKKTEVSMMVESALLFGNVPGGIVLPMRLGTPAKTHKGTEIPITLGLPTDVVTLVQVGNKYAAHAELRFAASDKNGNDSELPVVPLDVTSDHPPKPGGFIKFETKLTLNGDANHLVAAVYDPISGKVATAETDLKLP